MHRSRWRPCSRSDTLRKSFKLKAPKEENEHETPDELLSGCPRHHQSARRAGGADPGLRPRKITDRAGQDARFADQWLRFLHQHATPGRPPAGRDRAAAVSFERLARV